MKRRDDVWNEARAKGRTEVTEVHRSGYEAGYFDGYLAAQEIGKAALVAELRALAKEMCVDCKRSVPNVKGAEPNGYVHAFPMRSYSWCSASPIHARIAAIEGEG